MQEDIKACVKKKEKGNGPGTREVVGSSHKNRHKGGESRRGDKKGDHSIKQSIEQILGRMRTIYMARRR